MGSSGIVFFVVPSNVWTINIDVPEESKSVSLDNSEDRWWDQVDLSKLILANNVITELSEDIAQLPALSVLDVRSLYIPCKLLNTILFYGNIFYSQEF